MNQEKKHRIIEGVLKDPHYLENSSDLVQLIDIVSTLTEKELKSDIENLLDQFSHKHAESTKVLKEVKDKIRAL